MLPNQLPDLMRPNFIQHPASQPRVLLLQLKLHTAMANRRELPSSIRPTDPCHPKALFEGAAVILSDEEAYDLRDQNVSQDTIVPIKRGYLHLRHHAEVTSYGRYEGLRDGPGLATETEEQCEL